jgi:hypothetical protein
MRMLDTLMEEKKNIPSPDKYSCNAHTDNLRGHNPRKMILIYPSDRKNSFDYLIKKAKEVPGVSKYDITEYDEKKCKPPRGISKIKSERITFTMEAEIRSKEIPSPY